MLHGQIKPVVIKIIRKRLRYRFRKTPVMKPVMVIGFDMRYLLVADDKARIHKVLWSDIELVTSEQIMQVPIIKTVDQTKTVYKTRQKRSLFESSKKLNKK